MGPNNSGVSKDKAGQYVTLIKMSHGGTNVYTYNSYRSDVYKKVNSPLLKRCMRGGSLLAHIHSSNRNRFIQINEISPSQETMGGTECKHSLTKEGLLRVSLEHVLVEITQKNHLEVMLTSMPEISPLENCCNKEIRSLTI